MKEIWNTVLDFLTNNVLEVLKGITVIDVIDILILSVILFSVFKFIKERRAGKLALGLGLIALIFIFSVVFNLRAMNYILQHFYQVGMIAIIIIFQSDLRAALEKVGNSPLKNFKKNFSESERAECVKVSETISKVCDNFSRNKVGALIVIEGDTKLGDYLGQGEIVNADVSELLVRNIFFNKAPLHDGAMIIRDRRVFAAGCYLPLSTADVNKDLGTRHRAAIGLSEVSDALVIVVSEETGTISVAMNGTLTRNFNSATLKQAVLNYIAPPVPQKKGKLAKKGE